MRNIRIIITITISLALAAAIPAAAEMAKEPVEGLAVTVYNGGYGVVREVRILNIGADGVVQFVDVPTAIDPTTVHFKSLTDPDARLLEQNYRYDLVSADKLLEKYIDKDIQVITVDQTYSGQLMSFDRSQLVLKLSGEKLVMIGRGDNIRDISFQRLPEGLLTRPTLVWLVHTTKPGPQLVEVTYQTGGLNWHAEYVLVLGDGDRSGDLSGWVSVQNNSGKTYNNAKLKFIAGDVRRVRLQPTVMAFDRMAMRRIGALEAMKEKAFFEYHMYTLPRPSTLAQNEIKQLEMFDPAEGIEINKRFVYEPRRGYQWRRRQIKADYGRTSNAKVGVFLEFKNTKANKLGIPLPAGKIRVFKSDIDDETLEFIGEDRIDHTPKDEKISLHVGNAFDIVAERKQTDFHVDTNRRQMRETFEITIRNHKSEAVVVQVKETLTRAKNWKISSETHEHRKLDAHTIAWDLPIKADGETKLTYTVKYDW